jgi:FkbM family methyltransferase
MKQPSRKFSILMVVVAGILLAAVVALSRALDHSTDLVVSLYQEVSASMSRTAQVARKAEPIDIGRAALMIDRQIPEAPNTSTTYYESRFGAVRLRVLGRGQRIPLHTRPTASSTAIMVSGRAQVTHRFRGQDGLASITSRTQPGSIVSAPAMTGEEWVNEAADETQASLVFSTPAHDGNFYLGEENHEAIAGAAPTVFDVEAQLARLRAAGKAVSVESLGPLGDRLVSVAVAAPSDLGPFPDPAIIYVMGGAGTLKGDRTKAVRLHHLLRILPNQRIGVRPSADGPLVMLVFRPENDGTSDILKKGTKLYSQFDEELVIREFFQDRRQGFFVDVGAGDYQRFSTTFYLEKHLGWQGLAVDALASHAPGYAAHRPRTKFLNYLVTDRAKGKGAFFESIGFKEFSSADRQVAEKQLDFVYGRATVLEHEVPSITLTRLLEQQKIERIDFLSMDIEEHEPQALAGFDIERFQPKLVCVEAHPTVKARLLQYFARHGYVRIDKFLTYDALNWYFTPRATQP